MLIAPLLPFLLRTNDSPEGIERSVFDGEATGRRVPALLKNARSMVIAGGPHAII